MLARKFANFRLHMAEQNNTKQAEMHFRQIRSK